jgi:hypothetical protein
MDEYYTIGINDLYEREKGILLLSYNKNVLYDKKKFLKKHD